MFLWANACNTTMHLQNKSSHKILVEKTPEEAFTGVELEIGHLRIFGCLVYIHVILEKRTRLEPVRETSIFVGYKETSKAYKISMPMQQNIVVSQDVKFEENLASRKSHELPSLAESKEQSHTLPVQGVSLQMRRR